MQRFVTATAALLLAVTGAVAQQAKTTKTTAGTEYLQTPQGMALYVFDGDRTTGGTPGGPTCYDQCAKSWPAFTAGGGAAPNGDWTVVDRKDGPKQWAYKGRPLYTFVRDQQPGKTEGNGFNGNKWHLAVP